jgi:hypothetical protein
LNKKDRLKIGEIHYKIPMNIIYIYTHIQLVPNSVRHKALPCHKCDCLETTGFKRGAARPFLRFLQVWGAEAQRSGDERKGKGEVVENQ